MTKLTKPNKIIDKDTDEDGTPYCEICETYHHSETPCPENWY